MNLKHGRWWNLDAAHEIEIETARQRADHWWSMWGRIGHAAFWDLGGPGTFVFGAHVRPN